MRNLSRSESGDFATYRHRLLLDVHRQLVLAFRRREGDTHSLTRKALAAKLGIDKSIISRRLNGNSNLTLEVLSDMARAMEFIPVFRLDAYEDRVPPQSNSPGVTLRPMQVPLSDDATAAEPVQTLLTDVAS